ncbi:MAG: hypothetical protein B6D34_01050 [Candidatus Brocadia sp. UTAMX1]|jgi:hypothetical protein|nr:MAG: hypothetical protein B6D34_01050 [Candidatus Brocadia sp. UTAMX1]
MKTFGIFLGMMFGLALLSGGYFLFKYIVSVYDMLEPQVKTVAAIASVVAILCSVIISVRSKAVCASDGAVSKRADVYERLALFCTNRLKAGAEALADDRELATLEQLFALHGNTKVISVYLELRRTMREGEKEVGLLNKLILAMRADLGRRELNLKEKDILGLLLGHS